jgi:hypothetical protein
MNTTVAMEDGSDGAQVIARLVTAFPETTVEHLLELLSNHLAAPAAAELRERQVGLLVELISSGTGEVPGTDDYDQLRAKRTVLGQQWPHSTSLIRACGHWLKAVEAAMRLHAQGSGARVPSSYKHATGRRNSYTRSEVVWALERFKRAFGDWPTQWEFEAWRPLERRLARERGNLEPRISSLKQIRKLFGSYDRAVQVASAPS